VTASAVVRTEQLSKHYRHTIALDRLDLEIDAGEVFGYLGPNGAGKSTTIGLLLGLVRPSSGRAQIFGLDAWRDAPAIHRRLAYVPSEANLWPSLTGAEALRFLGEIHGSVETTYRDELVDRFDLTPDKKIRAYSHANRQKILLIAAFAARADLMLRFVGCTRNIVRRSLEHAERGWTLHELARVEDMDTARGLEQLMIDLARKQASGSESAGA
jgi:ABC-2 type transport system ATP-binding protein